MDRRELIDFVRARGLGVIASRGPDGSPQAALVGIAATDRGEIVSTVRDVPASTPTSSATRQSRS